MVEHTFNQTLRRQKQVNLSIFEASLVCKLISKPDGLHSETLFPNVPGICDFL